MQWHQLNVTVSGLRHHYQQQDFTPTELVEHLLERCEQYLEKNIWIYRLTKEELRPYLDELSTQSPESLPLFGVPFAIKDNIDLANIPTTAGCPEFSYIPKSSATVVQQLINAGAIPIGKTNLDQFATGLVGTRSPYGICKNAFNDEYISGGSSSGSAVAVSLGLASFSLGTDTAGSGRVPAALNQLIGLKPTRGLLSNSGVVPACKSLDSVSIFALTAQDAQEVLQQATFFDDKDAYSRQNPFENTYRVSGQGEFPLKLGIPRKDQLKFFNDEQTESEFEKTVNHWRELGAYLVEIDFTPFLEAAKLLYNGPWVAERYHATQSILDSNPDAMNPVVRSIIEPASEISAVQAYDAFYKLQTFKAAADKIFNTVDLILTPTTGLQPKIEEVENNPVEVNSQLGYYTNFMNLLDYSGISLPTGETPKGIPTGCTLVGKSFEDQTLLAWAERWQKEKPLPLGATHLMIKEDDLSIKSYQSLSTIDVVVCGAHLKGLGLHWQLQERNAMFIEATTTSSNYQLFALSDGIRPGIKRVSESGAAIEVEVWRLPVSQFGSFVACIPEPLGIGKIELSDGRWVSGFICEPIGVEDLGAKNITQYGGWKAFLNSQ